MVTHERASSGSRRCHDVAIAHDYLTQRGGAERVVLELCATFPSAPVITSLYNPRGTYSAFAAHTVQPSLLNRVPTFRRNHRLSLPLLAPTFERIRTDAQVLLASTSGWAHLIKTDSLKIVYCYSPPRWLYREEQYFGLVNSVRGRTALRALRDTLIRKDQEAALEASAYLTSSTFMRAHIMSVYGIDAIVIPPPASLLPHGRHEYVGLDPGYHLCVSRLLPYKNVDAVVDAFRLLPHERLVVAGDGPLLNRLRRSAPSNVLLTGPVSDATLRSLYSQCRAVITASYEDYGLTPIEGYAFGKPTAALRYGGFTDTVVDGKSGTFFNSPEPESIADAVVRLPDVEWDAAALIGYAEAQFSAHQFRKSIRALVDSLVR